VYTLYIRLFRMYIGLFRAYVGLFRAYIGLFCIGLTSLPNRQLQSATSISDSIFVGAISKFPMKIDTSYRSFQSLTALFFQLLEWSGSLSLFVHMYISFRPQVYQHMQHHICIVECEAERLIKGMRMVRGGGPEDDFLLKINTFSIQHLINLKLQVVVLKPELAGWKLQLVVPHGCTFQM